MLRASCASTRKQSRGITAAEGSILNMDNSEFIPYLVLVRFDRGEDLRDRLEE